MLQNRRMPVCKINRGRQNSKASYKREEEKEKQTSTLEKRGQRKNQRITRITTKRKKTIL